LDYIINFLPNISLYTNYYFYVSEPLEMQWLKIINIYDENINDWKIGTIFWEEKPTTGNFRINILVEELYTKYISNYITLNIIVSDVESFTILFALEFSFIITIIFTSVIFLYFHRVKSRNSSILSSKKNEK
jgi:hypothetical protein